MQEVYKISQTQFLMFLKYVSERLGIILALKTIATETSIVTFEKFIRNKLQQTESTNQI